MVSNGGRLPAGFTWYSTDGLPDDLRICGWERHNAKALVGLQAGVAGAASLRATELNLSLPRLRLARVSGSAHHVIRDETQVATTPTGAAVAYLALEGTGRFFHREDTETISPGQGIIVDADQPFERSFVNGLTELVISIPRRVLTERTAISGPRRPHLFEFAGEDTGPGHRLACLTRTALAGEPLAWEPLEVELVSLVTDLLSAESDTSYLALAERFIHAHAHRPGLSAAEVAQAVGISQRHLSRVFSAAGRSVPRAILEARLTTAYRLLSAPELSTAPMSEVAERCGFSSQAQFSRDYRAHFATTPLRHRRELLATG